MNANLVFENRLKFSFSNWIYTEDSIIKVIILRTSLTLICIFKD